MPTSVSAHPQRPRRRLGRWIALTSLAATIGLLVGAGCALTCKPRWYQPAAIDYSRLDADKRDATNLGDRIGDGLNTRQAVEIELDEAQLNRWVAARNELPPGISLDLGPLRNPFIDLLEGNQVRIGALVERGGVAVVASAIAQITVDAESVRIRVEAVRAGSALAPLGLIDPLLRDALARAGQSDHLAADGSIVIPNDFVWPNGKKRFRVTNVQIDDRAARIRLEPR